MGSKPKKSDFKQSAAEAASASVALDRQNWFNEMYGPKLKEMMALAKSDDPTQVARGRANADTMQATTAPSARRALQGVGGGDISQALQGQLGLATAEGTKLQNKMGSEVIGVAQGQSADNSAAMSRVANLATSEALARATAKQAERDAMFSAAGQLAGATLMRGMQNRKTKGMREGPLGADGMGPGAPEAVQGSFWSPVDEQGNSLSFFGRRVG